MCPNGKFPQFEDSNKMPKRRKFQAGGQRRHPAVVDNLVTLILGNQLVYIYQCPQQIFLDTICQNWHNMTNAQKYNR
jgi:hypothetical protein